MKWRLFAMVTPMGELLCLEIGGFPESCTGTFVSGTSRDLPEEWSVMGDPTASDGEPVIVFGTIGTEVARVMVELPPG